ncbi:hypothetical protein [Hymenobacter norwichensis]|uniref:hypothetical protein n=1 Tax=Hymenobacter norwichensis TaxID=223903 RepID=UPI0003B749BE|nr:hypothetical protein [Hymenobacter norwichensis]
MQAPSNSSRAKHAATLSGQPPQARGTSVRAQQGAARNGQPTGAVASARAKTLATGRNPALATMGQKRVVPTKVLGAKDLVGQRIQTMDGNSYRITRLEVVLPDTDQCYAIMKCYGAPADATRVDRRPGAMLYKAQPRNQVPLWPRAVVRPADPKYAPGPFDHKTYIGDPIDVTGKHWNGVGALLEGHALTHASKNKINNSFYRGTQRFNRVVGRKVVAPARVASGAATVARGVTSSRLARFSSRFGGKIGGVGAALSASKIAYELSTDNYNAHTAIDGGMLVVTLVGIGVTASAVAAGVTAPAWVPIAGAVIMVYGILDYAFDVNGKIDQAVGREDKKKK